MPSKFEKAVLALLPSGYSVQNRRGHSRLLDPEGEVVRRFDGKPLTLPGSPSSHRAMVVMRQRLRECGIET